MKINLHTFPQNRASRDGSSVIVVLAFLAIMVLLVAANTKTVNWLRAEVRLTDQREISRLNASLTNQTNHAASAIPQTASP